MNELVKIEADSKKSEKEKFSDLQKELKAIIQKYSFNSKEYKTAFYLIVDIINNFINSEH